VIIRHAGSRRSALSSFSGSNEWFLFDGLEKYRDVEWRGFGAWDPATAARGVVFKVKLAYGAGGGLQSIFPIDWQDTLAQQPLLSVVELFIPGIFTSPSKGAMAKAYRDLGAQIDDWADRKFRWAQAGRRDDGTSYSWKQWGDLGQVYLDSITYQASLPVTNGLWANAATSVKEFIQSVLSIFQPTEWPTWAKVAAGVVGLAAVAYIVNSGRGLVRDIRAR
jgi:hypothetical protein